MDNVDKYLNEEDKYRIEIKGITHDWMSLDKAKFDPDGKRYTKKEAEQVIKKAIKAGRKPNFIRMIKEEKLDILERMELQELISETIEFANDDELSEKAVETAGWDKDSVAKFGKTLGKSPKEHGFFDACVAKMGSKVKNPQGLCASLIDTYKGTTKWRGKKHE